MRHVKLVELGCKLDAMFRDPYRYNVGHTVGGLLGDDADVRGWLPKEEGEMP